VFCTVWCLSKSYAHTNNCKNKITCCGKKREKRKEKKRKKEKQKRKIQWQRVGTNVRVPGFNAGLLARSQLQLHSEGPATSQLDQGFPWSQSKC
jgi:hypothetical protein